VRYALDADVWLYSTTHAAFADEVDRLGLWPVGLSAVVAAELGRRALTRAAVSAADAIVARWRHALMAPSASDWLLSATTLRSLRRRHRYEAIGLSRLQNDALIAASCARVGWTVVTTNRVDFERLAAALGKRAPNLVFLRAPE
jgi:predicted nucleic acid-binding protein